MGANTTQAVAILIMLIGFVLLAGAFAGGGFILAAGAVALLAVSVYFFLKCKPWEHQE
jgi:membrane protein implicated in regulation of membrane protease activity